MKWAQTHEWMDAILRPFGEAVVEAAQLPTGGLVVDVGCGCGATTLMAAQSDRRLTLAGVDVSTPMLEVARERAAAQDLPIEFLRQDAATATFAEPVRRVLSRFGVMFFDDPAAAFANIRGWLAPGGRIAMAVWNPLADNPWFSGPVGIVDPHAPVALPPLDGPNPFSLGDPSHTEALLAAAGFVDIEQRDMGLPMRLPGTIDEIVTFHCDRTAIAEALERAAPPQRAAAVEALRASVVEVYDGRAVVLGASARLVCARVAD